MKKFFTLLATLLAVTLVSVGFVSCSNDDDDSSSSSSSSIPVWKLCDFGGSYSEKSESDLSPVSWGEYLHFAGDTVYWNCRLGGEDTTYSCKSTKTSYTLYDKDTGVQKYVFTVLKQTDSMLVLQCDDGNYRWYKKGTINTGDSSGGKSSGTAGSTSSSDGYIYVAVVYSGSSAGTVLSKKVSIGGSTVSSNGTGKSSYTKVNASGRLSYTTYYSYKKGSGSATVSKYNQRTGGGTYTFTNGRKYTINCANGSVSKD